MIPAALGGNKDILQFAPAAVSWVKPNKPLQGVWDVGAWMSCRAEQQECFWVCRVDQDVFSSVVRLGLRGRGLLTQGLFVKQAETVLFSVLCLTLNTTAPSHAASPLQFFLMRLLKHLLVCVSVCVCVFGLGGGLHSLILEDLASSLSPSL